MAGIYLNPKRLGNWDLNIIVLAATEEFDLEVSDNLN